MQILQKREYRSALGPEGLYNVSLGIFVVVCMLGLFQITDLWWWGFVCLLGFLKE